MENGTYLKIIVRDKQKRIIFKVIDDKVLVMRLPDMSDCVKSKVTFLYFLYTTLNDFGNEITKEDMKKYKRFLKSKEGKSLKAFLNFEDDGSGENEFCS